VVQDISMPGRDGLELLKDLRREFPRLSVLVLSIHPSEQYGVRALKLGAAAYLNKKTVPEELVKAIRQVVGGGRYITQSLADLLAQQLTTDQKRPHETLSDREYQVMRMIATGKKPREIASDLALSPKSISAYRSRILEKMGMKTNADLVHYAITNDLL
jgi:DNA-binding NarL/FixJ family response regulator